MISVSAWVAARDLLSSLIPQKFTWSQPTIPIAKCDARHSHAIASVFTPEVGLFTPEPTLSVRHGCGGTLGHLGVSPDVARF